MATYSNFEELYASLRKKTVKVAHPKVVEKPKKKKTTKKKEEKKDE